MRSATVRWLREVQDWEVCGETSSAAATFKGVDELQPDMLITELMPAGDVQFVRELRQRFPRLHILVFAAIDQASFAARVRAAGASGFVAKNAGPEKLIARVHALLGRPNSVRGKTD